VVEPIVDALNKLSLASPVSPINDEAQDDIIEQPLPPLSQPLSVQEYTTVTMSAEEQMPVINDNTPLRDNYLADTTVTNFSETIDGSDEDDVPASTNDVELRGEIRDTSSSSDVTAATLSPSSSEVRGDTPSQTSSSEVRGASSSEIRGVRSLRVQQVRWR
jgi:hypothetical protein